MAETERSKVKAMMARSGRMKINVENERLKWEMEQKNAQIERIKMKTEAEKTAKAAESAVTEKERLKTETERIMAEPDSMYVEPRMVGRTLKIPERGRVRFMWSRGCLVLELVAPRGGIAGFI